METRLHGVLALVCALALLSAAPAQSRPADPRPRAWCGWYMRQLEHVADRRFNVARRWAAYGDPAPGPALGAIVVWPHHVGKIVGGGSGAWIVLSGNDGHRVRRRVRDLSRAIAFRRPPGRVATN